LAKPIYSKKYIGGILIMSNSIPNLFDDTYQSEVINTSVRNVSFLETAMLAVSNGVVITDYNQPDNPIVYVNPGFERLTGYSAVEILGRNCRFLQNDDCEQPVLAEIRHALAEGRPATVVLRNYRKDGTLFYNELQLSPIHDADGRLTHYIGIQNDVTARIEAEEKLKQSELRFRSLLEHTSEMITMTGEKGQVLYQSPSVAIVMGYELEELAGRNSFDFVHPDDVVMLLGQQKLLLQQAGTKHENEFRFRHKDGTWHYIEAHAQNLLHVPGVEAIVINGRDVTARKTVEIALRRSEEMLNFALDAAGIGIWEYDFNTKRLECSSQLEKLLGVAQGSINGIHEIITNMILPDDREKIVKEARNALLQGTDFLGLFRVKRPDGQIRWMESKGRTHFDAEHRPLRMSGTLQDITTRKNSEENLAHSEMQLRQAQKMEAIGQLAGGIAHDFNNFLTAIIGYGDLVLNTLPDQDPLYADIAEISHAAKSAAELTNQLLAFSRQQVLQINNVNLNEVVTNISRMIQRLIGANIQLVTVLEPILAQVAADRSQLEQVLLNLAVNARDAMPKGGKLIFETANIEVKADDFSSHSHLVPGFYVRLTVSDTGAGMSEAVRSRLFEPFFTTKERGHGTGLGLSTVYGIIKQSGGHIDVYSAEGHGSSFIIYLPSVSNIEVKGTSELAGSKPKLLDNPTDQITILLVEDEESIRKLATRVLERQGYKVLVARHGEHALEIVQNYPGSINLLITDMIMPHLSGPELSRQLLSQQPNLRVIYMSGYTDQSVLEQNMLGDPLLLQNFLHKPFGLQTLLDKVQEVLTHS
jgi:two-component system, cell cycle sensor histidine kinase and response regulator CckA